MVKKILWMLITCLLIVFAVIGLLFIKNSKIKSVEDNETAAFQPYENSGENTDTSELQTGDDAEPENPTTDLQSEDNSEPETETIEFQQDDGIESANNNKSKVALATRIVQNGVLGKVDYPFLSAYGYRDNYGTAISTDHRGIDFKMDEHTVLCAPVDTVVSYVGENDVRGKWLVMYLGKGLYLEYQHLSEVYVYQGQYVAADTPVCESGDTGVSLMPHLHLEILVSPEGYDSVTDFEEMSLRTDPTPYLGMDISSFSD